MPADAPEPIAAGADRADGRRALGRWALGRWRLPVPSIAEIPLLLAFAVAAWRNKWIADDGYIYLTFVDRTLDGEGAGFNTGERVEAYTSAGWFAIVTALRFVVRLGSLETLVLLLGLLMSFVAVAMLPAIERRAWRRRSPSTAELAGADADAGVVARLREPVLGLPLALAAGTYVFTSFATSGLETPLLLLWCSSVAMAAWAPQPRAWVLTALAAAAPLVRPDLGLLAVGLVVCAWRVAPAGRRRWWIPVAAAAPLAVSVVVRIAAYGQLVPNTYYAKTDTGHGWSDGVAYLRDSAMPYALQWLAVLAVGAALARPIHRWIGGSSLAGALDPAARRSLLLLGAAAVTAIQVMTVGGDFMHGRFWIVPWWFVLTSLAGLGTTWLNRRTGPPVRALGVALAASLVVFAVQSWSTSMQRLYAADRFFGLGDITDEQAFYESANPDVHALVPDNQSPLFRLGRDLSALSVTVGDEIGVTIGAIGQVSYGGATGDGDVFVYDLVGLTRPDVSRLEVIGDTRVGHARVAPDVMAATHPRVDFHTPYFPGYAEAFTVQIGDTPLVLVDLDLIDDLRRAGVIDATVEARMRAYLDTALAGPTLDANFVTFLRERVQEDTALLARIEALSSIERSSSWRAWLDRTADERADLATEGCGGRGWFGCLGLAVDRHRAPAITVDVTEPDPRSR